MKNIKHIGIDIGSYSIKVSLQINPLKNEELIWEGGDREFNNIVSFGNSRNVSRVMDTREENLPQIIQSVTNFVANNIDQTFQEALNFNFCKIYKQNDDLIFEITYKGKKHSLKKCQVIAAIFSYIKENSELKNQEIQVSISIPDSYSENEKLTIVEGMQIAGIEKFNLVHQSVSLISYFLFERRQIDDYSNYINRQIIFIDIGHSSVALFFVQIHNNEVKIIHRAIDNDIGVASLDRVVQNYIVNDIWKKYQINMTMNLKLNYRLRVEIQKKRKMLSSNSIVELELDSFPKENSFYGLKLTRDSFNNLNSDIALRFENFLIKNIQNAENKGFIFKNWEIQRVGGGSRIPLFKESIHKVFRRDSSTNINGNLYLSEGSLFYQTISHQFNFEQTIPNDYIIEMTSFDDGNTNETILFEKGTQFGSYREIQINSADYSKVECFEKGQFIKMKVLEIDQDDIYDANIQFKIDQNGFLIANNDSIKVKKNNNEEIEQMIELENQFVLQQQEEIELDKYKYELESKVINMKQLVNSMYLSPQEKQNIKQIIVQVNDWSQKNSLNFMSVQDYKDKLKFINDQLDMLNQREEKVKRVQQWVRNNQQQLKNFLSTFELQHADQLAQCDENQGFQISRFKWKILKNLNVLNELSHTNNYEQFNVHQPNELIKECEECYQKIQEVIIQISKQYQNFNFISKQFFQIKIRFLFKFKNGKITYIRNIGYSTYCILLKQRYVLI